MNCTLVLNTVMVSNEDVQKSYRFSEQMGKKKSTNKLFALRINYNLKAFKNIT